MQDFYLLRNNVQTGPYSLEALLKQQLQPLDLIWIDGKSASWQHPSEIQELKNAVPAPEASADENTTNAAKSSSHIYVSMPNQWKAPAEPTKKKPVNRLRQKIANSVKRKQAPETTTNELELNTKYKRPLTDIKKDYSAWQYKKKKRKYARKQHAVIAFLVVLSLLTAGYLASQYWSNSAQAIPVATDNANTPTEDLVEFNENNTAEEILETDAELTIPAANDNNTEDDNTLEEKQTTLLNGAQHYTLIYT